MLCQLSYCPKCGLSCLRRRPFQGARIHGCQHQEKESTEVSNRSRTDRPEPPARQFGLPPVAGRCDPSRHDSGPPYPHRPLRRSSGGHHPAGAPEPEAGPDPGMTADLLAGALAGLAVAMPVGAIGAYLLGLAARERFGVAAVAALGVATTDGL